MISCVQFSGNSIFSCHHWVLSKERKYVLKLTSGSLAKELAFRRGFHNYH